MVTVWKFLTYIASSKCFWTHHQDWLPSHLPEFPEADTKQNCLTHFSFSFTFLSKSVGHKSDFFKAQKSTGLPPLTL